MGSTGREGVWVYFYKLKITLSLCILKFTGSGTQRRGTLQSILRSTETICDCRTGELIFEDLTVFCAKKTMNGNLWGKLLGVFVVIYIPHTYFNYS